MFFITSSHAQAPKTEIRAVWVATVSNLDFPTGSNRFDVEEQKKMIHAILDTAISLNLNAVFFQIRPMADALYESDYVPWSQYISGQRGTNPGYDPLAFILEEAHKRGLEIHGWLNPYRYESFIGQHDGRPGDFKASHPEWILDYDDNRIFNPGVPEVQQHLKNIVGEIINKYDIDGIHFDDYFYKYGGTTDEDADTYNTYGGDFTDIGDWRRDNVNDMIELVFDTIQSVKPHVRFGISPFGIYGNNDNPEGITGLDAYNRIYTDPKQWLSSGHVDYINPQLYWPIGGSQDFDALAHYWAQMAKDNDRHMIAGHGIYRYDNNPDVASRTARQNLHENKDYFDWDINSSGRALAGGWTLDQITRQIDITRKNRDLNAVGSVYFRYQDFIRVQGLAKQIKDLSYGTSALMPAMSWKGQPDPASPQNAQWVEDDKGVFYISWDAVGADMRYVVYASENESPEEDFFDDPVHIVKVLYTNTFYLEEESSVGERPHLFIKAYDRFGNESTSSASFSGELPSVASTLSTPADGSTAVSSFTDFSWSSATNAQYYKIEFSETNTFDDLVFEANVNATSINAGAFPFKGDQRYYWRVASGNFFGFGATSEVFSFNTGFPGSADMIYPVPDEQLVDLQPLIKWQPSSLIAGVRFQIAKGGAQFELFNVLIDEDLGALSEYQITEPLDEWTTYHMRIQLYNDLGQGEWEYFSFKTLKVLPQAPTITSPQLNDEYQFDQFVQFSWSQQELATGYRAILSKDIDRLDIVEERDFFSANDLVWNFGLLLPGSYYFNIAGRNVGGLGEWTQQGFSVTGILSSENPLPKVWATYDSKDLIILSVGALIESVVDFRIVDLLGRQINARSLHHKKTNIHEFHIDRTAFSGIAIATISVDGETHRVKLKGK